MTEGSHPLVRASRVAGPLLLGLGVLAIPFALAVPIDNRIERWVGTSGAAARDYEAFRATFGSDELVLVAYSGPDLFDEAALDAQLAALEELEAIEPVLRVSGPPVVYRDVLGELSPEKLRDELLSTPFYRDFVIDPDGRVGGLWIETELGADPAALVADVEAASAPLREAGFAVHVVGPPVLNAALDHASGREAQRTFPIAIGLSIVVLGWLFRSWRPTAVAVCCAGLSVLLAVGVVGATGRSLNMITTVLPPLLWVLALSNAIHVLQRFQAQRRVLADGERALSAALRETALPCALSALTTALGFASLLAADLAPIRELGAFAATGLVLSLGVNLGLGPLLIRWLRVPAAPDARSWRGVEVGARLAARRPALVLGAGAAAIAIAVAALGFIRVESDPLTFLPADAPVVRDYREVARSLTGFYTMEVVVDVPGGWLDAGVWPALDGVAQRIASVPGVARVLSPLDWLRKLQHWRTGPDPARYELPPDGARASALVDELTARGGDGRLGLVADGGEQVRLSALVTEMPSSRFRSIQSAAEDALAALPAPLAGHVTGVVRRLVDAQLGLVETQLRSLGLAFCTVFVCIGVGLRSLRLTLASIAPNLLPIGAAFAAMAALGIALDAATVMMASVALGIAVDDTVHLLAAHRRALGSGRSEASAAAAALREVGPALVVTTVTACIGFFCLLGSSFAPVRFFGLLSGIAMGVALLADGALLPAILVVSAPREEAAT